MTKSKPIHSQPSVPAGADVSTQLTVLQTIMQNVVTAFEDFRLETRTEIGEIKNFYTSLSEKFNERRQTHWPTVLAWFVASTTIVSAAFYIITLKTENTISPVQQEVAGMVAVISNNKAVNEKLIETVGKIRTDLDTNTARDEVSQMDRVKLNQRSDKAEDHLAKLETDNQVITAKLTEVETQFSASDEIRNLQFADIKRTEAILWNSQHGVNEYPSGPYYFPHISNRDGSNH